MNSVKNSQYIDHYEYAFIGTSAICLIEALYLQSLGKRVILIDDKPQIGGVWTSLDIFGLHDVENAIHYFVYDRAGIEFMRTVLGWEIIKSPRKYRIFPKRLIGLNRLRYDNPIGLILARVLEPSSGMIQYDNGLIIKLKFLFKVLLEAISRKGESYYFKDGTPSMMKNMEILARQGSLKFMLETSVDKLHFDRFSKNVQISTSRGSILVDSIIITHGSRLPTITTDLGKIEIEKEVHRRPQIHLLISDISPVKLYEGIFVGDKLIKYVHDITRFTKESADLDKRKKLFVIALQHDCDNSPSLYISVFERLKLSGVIGKNAILENTHWYESYLPELSNKSLERLKKELHPMLDVLFSDNFCLAVGLYSQRWKNYFSSNTPHLLNQ